MSYELDGKTAMASGENAIYYSLSLGRILTHEEYWTSKEVSRNQYHIPNYEDFYQEWGHDKGRFVLNE